jgi:hypothetical protein
VQWTHVACNDLFRLHVKHQSRRSCRCVVANLWRAFQEGSMPIVKPKSSHTVLTPDFHQETLIDTLFICWHKRLFRILWHLSLIPVQILQKDQKFKEILVYLEDGSLLGCSAVRSRWSRPTFQRCVLPPSSGRCWKRYTPLRLHDAISEKTIVHTSRRRT